MDSKLLRLTAHMKERDIKYFHYVNGYNLFNKIADPFMIGYAYKNCSDFVCKFV